ncbi:MAG: LemA family protein [Myxococcales bacterium]|nr:LemA family protein [Myxococcales bacterium]
MVQLLVLALAAVFIAPGCQSYDELVAKNEACNQKWADLEANLQRRADLIPQLVATVKGAAKYEESTLTKITQARAEATSIKLSAEDLSDPAKVNAFMAAQEKLSSGALSRLLIANENYPKLQASSNYTDLMKQLEGTENRILRAREEYNKAVGLYNTELGKIKGSAVNKATGKPFQPRVYFSASPAAQTAPAVSF